MKDHCVEAKAYSKPKYILYYEKYMIVMGMAGQLLFYLQGIKIFVTKSASDISIWGFLLGFAAVASWTVYGILIKNKVIMIPNLIAVLGAAFTILGILLYGP